MLKTTKRFVLIATTAVVLTSSAGCNLSSFRQVTNNLIGSSFSQGNSETSTQADNDTKEIKGTIEELSNLHSSKELKDCVKQNFKSNTVSLALDGKSKKEIKLYLEVLQKLEFISYKDGKLKYSVPSIDGIVNYLSSDYKGFIKDYNNFKTLKLSKDEVKDYVLDYLIQLFDSDSGYISDGSNSIKNETKTCSITVTRSGKLSTDSFLTELVSKVLEDLFIKVANTTFSPEPQKTTTKVKSSDFKIGKSKVMVCPLTDKTGKVISQQKILVTVDSVLKDQTAYEKLCSISGMNANISVDYQKNSLYYVHYTIRNLSGTDLTYNDSFSMVSSDGNSYSLPNGSCFGLTSSTVLKKGSDTSLDTALIGPRNAKLGWYDSTAKYFYQLGTEEA